MNMAGRHILLVEDDPLVLVHLSTLLERQGAKVTALSSIRELRAFNPHDTDLAILDVSLGDGHVGDHLTSLKEAGTALLFHTGQEDPAAMTRDHPGSYVLEKPSREEDLLALCETILSPS